MVALADRGQEARRLWLEDVDVRKTAKIDRHIALQHAVTAAEAADEHVSG